MDTMDGNWTLKYNSRQPQEDQGHLIDSLVVRCIIFYSTPHHNHSNFLQALMTIPIANIILELPSPHSSRSIMSSPFFDGSTPDWFSLEEKRITVYKRWTIFIASLLDISPTWYKLDPTSFEKFWAPPINSWEQRLWTKYKKVSKRKNESPFKPWWMVKAVNQQQGGVGND